MSKKLSINLNKSNFPDFISKIQDLSNINDVVKLKIESDKVLMYSMKANEAAVLALKSYILPSSNYFDNFEEEQTFDFIIVNAPRFIKSLKFFDIDKQIKMDIIYKNHHDNGDVMQIRSAQFSNGKLKISIVAGEDDKIRDLNTDLIETRTDIDNANFNFQISKQDFNDVKKLCAIDSEDKILNIEIEKGKITANEPAKWELQLGEIDDSIDSKIVFNKKYLSNINADPAFIDLYMFDTFILVKDDISNLMLSFEQTFDDDDE
jgi:hypothetical protein